MKTLIEAIKAQQLRVKSHNQARRESIQRSWSECNDNIPANKDRNGSYHAPVDGYMIDGCVFGKGQFIPFAIEDHDERDGVFYGVSGSYSSNPKTRIKMGVDEASALIDPLFSVDVKCSKGMVFGVDTCYLYIETEYRSVLKVITSYFENIENQAENDRKAHFANMWANKVKLSEYVGVIGKRQTFSVTVSRIHSFQGDSFGYYDDGIRVIVEMTDADNNIIVYIGNDNNIGNVGDVLVLKATVKTHTEYQGLKQTKVNRPKVQ
jgi:hypothetical protein